MSQTSRPTGIRDRIPALDVIRGFALLGILTVNIQSFSMPFAAYFNPAAYGDLNGLNRLVWMFGHLFADQKFMTIFSILFGAGVVLMASRAEKAGRSPAALHYRRMVLLLFFGAIHAYLIWYGDILVIYAMKGMIVFAAWRRSARTLIIIGLLMVAIGSGLSFLAGWSMPQWPEAERQMHFDTWQPSRQDLEVELATYRGGWVQQQQIRVPKAFEFHTFIFLFWALWRSGGLMLIGMGLFKSGFFERPDPRPFARRAIAAALLVGIPLIVYGMMRNIAVDWDPGYSFFLGGQYNYWGSLIVAFAYIGVVSWIGHATDWSSITRPFAAVGRTAFSNYILQTVLCTSIFYGHGLGLFGSIERVGQALIVLVIWGFQLAVSPLWLRHFHSGPLEWLWRSLTYGTRQPFRRLAKTSENR